MRWLRKLSAAAGSPTATLLTSLILIVSSLTELGETVYTFADGLQDEHGVALLGLVGLLKSLGDLDEGIGRVDERRLTSL